MQPVWFAHLSWCGNIQTPLTITIVHVSIIRRLPGPAQLFWPLREHRSKWCPLWAQKHWIQPHRGDHTSLKMVPPVGPETLNTVPQGWPFLLEVTVAGKPPQVPPLAWNFWNSYGHNGLFWNLFYFPRHFKDADFTSLARRWHCVFGP